MFKIVKKIMMALFAISAAFAMAYLSVVNNIGDNSIDPIKSYDREYTKELKSGGELCIKEKKYAYNGADVMIVRVDNCSQLDLNLTFVAKFTDADGNVLNTQIRRMEGFPKEFKNYFVFETGVAFETVSLNIITSEFKGETYAEYLEPGHDVLVEAHPRSVSYFDDPGRPYDNPLVDLIVSYPFDCTYPTDELFRYSADFVLFDVNGEIYQIDHAYNKDISASKFYGDHVERVTLLPDDISWDDYVLPRELKGDLKGIIALNSVFFDKQ